MSVNIRYQNGTLTIDFGDQSQTGTDLGTGTTSRGPLVLGPIIIPLGSDATGSGPGSSPIGGDPGDGDDEPGPGSSTVGGGPGSSGIGGDTGGQTTGCGCPTVIGPIVFTGGSATASQPTLKFVNMAGVTPTVGTNITPSGVFDMQAQEEGMWCWAAVAVSVNNFLGTPNTWTQRKLVSQILGRDCSADTNPASPCNSPFNLEGPLARVGNLFDPNGAQFDRIARFSDLQDYWARFPLPVCLRIVWHDGSGQAHFIALTGATRLADGTQLLMVNDPAPHGFGPAQWDYDQLRLNYGSPGSESIGQWNDTYFVQANQ